MNRNDTICAISTPQGCGGIAVVRISGPEALDITDRLWKGKSLKGAKSHTAHLGTIMAGAEPLDQAVATVFKAPNSFTGEDVVELSVHGSVFIQHRLVNLLIDNGCRLAEPGEFTRKAFLAGKMDLAQAEGVADLIASTSQASHRIAFSQMKGRFSDELSKLRDDLLHLTALLELELDFSEEDVEFASRKELLDRSEDTLRTIGRLESSFAKGDAIKRGVPVAIIGETNAGKSTLLNNLLGEERAIVSDIHGTTRDTIEETFTVNGITFRLIDTAGIRQTDDAIEEIGINRTLEKIGKATIILWVIDPTSKQDINGVAELIKQRKQRDASLIAVINKADLLSDDTEADSLKKRISELFPDTAILVTSAKSPDTKGEIEGIIYKASPIGEVGTQDVIVTNARHYESLKNAGQSLLRVIDGLKANLSGDFVAQDLRETIHHLSSITGEITTPEVLKTIFSSFCIGK